MKKCGRCSKPAVLHITELNQGEVQALHLCESCAKDYLTNPQIPEDDDEDEAAMEAVEDFEEVEEEEEEEVSESSDPPLSCPNCGITFKEFRSQGRLGCSHDYVAFRAELLPLLENIHSATQHQGKVPNRAPHSGQQQFELVRLRNALREAIEGEDYESAAKLRDEIRSREAELHGSGESGT